MKQLATLLAILAVASSALAQNPKKVPGSGFEAVEEIVFMGGEMYYSGFHDPAPTGTIKQKFRKVTTAGIASANINTGLLSDMEDLTPLGDRIYFRGKTVACGAWTLYYYSDLDGIVSMTHALYPGGIPSAHIFTYGGVLYNFGRFACPFDDHPFLWSYDGSTFTSIYEFDPMGAVLFPVLSVTEGSPFIEYGGLLYFTGALQLKSFDPVTNTTATILTTTSGIWNMIVHDGKLWFCGDETGFTKDLYSYDGSTVVKELDLLDGPPGVLGSPHGRLNPFLSHGTDLYFSVDFDAPPGGEVFYKFDGTDTTRVNGSNSTASTLFGGDLYFTSGGDHVTGHHIARLEGGVPRLVTGWTAFVTPLPRLLTEYAGSLYFASNTNPDDGTAGTHGLYIYEEGLVLDAMDSTSVAPCDPATSTYDVTVELNYHGSTGGGTFEFNIVNTVNDDTIMVSVPETTSPQSHTFSLPVLYTESIIDKYTILVPEYINAADPDHRTLEVVDDIDVDIPLPCIPCELSVEFTDQTCTAVGMYDQTIVLSWDTAYTPDLSTDGVLITIDGLTYIVIEMPWTYVAEDRPATGGYVGFDIELEDISSSPCALVDSVISPICECTMTATYDELVSCDPVAGHHTIAVELTYTFPPPTGGIDNGDFITPITASPQTIFMVDAPNIGAMLGAAISFEDEPTCGAIIEWIAPLPDCTAAVDCPGLLGDIGEPCDDGDPDTGMDTITPSCTCEGVPLDCEGVPGGPATPGTPCDDGDPATTMDVYLADCTCAGTPPVGGMNDLSLVITTDDMGSETSWEILPDGSMTPVCSGSGYTSNSVITEMCSVADGCYILKVYDSMGDGMFTGDMGGYVLYDGLDERIIDNEADGDFGSESSIAFDGTFCVPLGADRLIASSCDKEERLATDFVIASSNPAVAAEYGGPDEATSGYQFWLFDPDGTYSRRVFYSHANPATGAPSGPAAAAHMRPSNLVTLPPPVDVLLNVRVRSRVAGVYSAFGPACRFKIAPAPTACPTTQLIDDMSSFAHSCGVMRTFGGSDKIYAEPIAGANKYQFRFENASEGFLRHIAFSGYVCVLNWVTAPLTEGTTYDVSVRASFNGGATYCDWGDACSVTIMPAGPSFTARSVDVVETSSPTLFPNPNDGRSMWITLGDQIDMEAPVNIAVLDMTGKMIQHTNMVVSPSPTAVRFNDQLASGTYMILIEQGGYRHHERLVVH